MYLSHVYLVLTQTSLHICAILQEHLLLAYSVLISCVSGIDSNQPIYMCNLARAFTACTKCTYLMCIRYWLKPAYVYVQSCKSIYCLHIMYLSHVYPVLTQTSLDICAILQEHLLLAHSVLISCVSGVDSNQPTYMCNLARAFTACI